jgi:archaellum component FlaF (FlaF/FlaG flagellin family)
MKEDPFKLYDILVSTGILKNVIDAISEDDWNDIQENVWETIKSVYSYKNSILGILEAVKSDYSSVNFDMTDLQDKLNNPEELALLKDVLAKLG